MAWKFRMNTCLSIATGYICTIIVSTVVLLLPDLKYAMGSSPTTQNFQDIFMGRCYEFQNIIRPDLFSNSEVDCNYLWQTFTSGFQEKDPCSVETKGYDEFLSMAATSIPTDKGLLWSGTYPFVYRYSDSGNKYTAIGDTLYGYLVEAMHWCGYDEQGGFNYDNCPEWGSCNRTAELSFWRAASIRFAQEAEGTVQVMLNGSRSDSFRNTSVFGKEELPIILTSGKVTHLKVFLVHDVDDIPRVKCNTGSILQLKEIVENAENVTFSCEENPLDIAYLLCADKENPEECKATCSKLDISSAQRFSHFSCYLPAILLIYFVLSYE